MDVMDGQAERRKLATELSRKIQGCNRQELAWRKGEYSRQENACEGGGLDGLRCVLPGVEFEGNGADEEGEERGGG